MASSAERVRRTQEVWKSRFGSEISFEDARRLNDSLVTFFRLLKRWQRRADADSPRPEGYQIGSDGYDS